MSHARTPKRWKIAADQHQPATDSVPPAMPPLVWQLLTRRGVDTPQLAADFLDPKLTHLHDPVLIPGIPRAAQRITDAVHDQQPIVIYGDYDVDGITASAILWHMLTLAGANVRTYVPHRIEEGYGLNGDAIAMIAQGQDVGCGISDLGFEEKSKTDPLTLTNNALHSHSANPKSQIPNPKSPPLIISVDCGITAVEPARVARECGADLIITDHHEFDRDQLPDAHTLVHPRLTDPNTPPYPFPHLCGAGVAYKLAWQFAKTHCRTERKLPPDFQTLLLDLLSLAALGTVADIVPLQGENRIITAFGLRQIKRTRIIGLNALIDAASLRGEKIDAYDVGFKLGPRINACGRMGHAKKAVHLLTAASPDEAAQIATFLTGENEKRRATERAIFDEAKDMVVASGYDHTECRAIVLGKQGWHPGVVGIVASRIVEAFSRPAILLSYSDDGEAHGSARSVEGVSIHEAIGHCASDLTSFGGHAMAAGLRLEVQRVESFRSRLVAFINGKLAATDLVGILDIDARCTLDDLTPDFFRYLDKLAPFGRDNPAPLLLLERVAIDRSANRMGGEGKHLSVTLRRNNRIMRAVGFGMGDLAPDLVAGVKIDAVVVPVISTWQGDRRSELHIKDLRISP